MIKTDVNAALKIFLIEWLRYIIPPAISDAGINARM